jgi:hypothetical protein
LSLMLYRATEKVARAHCITQFVSQWMCSCLYGFYLAVRQYVRDSTMKSVFQSNRMLNNFNDSIRAYAQKNDYLFESFSVVRTEYWLEVINIFDFLSTGLGESEEDDKFLLLMQRLLVDWAAILRKRKDRI